VVSWLIAHRYAVLHTGRILAWFGLSATRKGSHLLSLSVDTALVHYGLSLAAALVCAYAAHRLVLRVRDAVDAVRARALEAPRESPRAREAATAGPRETRAPGATGRAR
jgi:hypothetical protein